MDTAQDRPSLFSKRQAGTGGPQEFRASDQLSRRRPAHRGLGGRSQLTPPSLSSPSSRSRALGPAGVLGLQVRGTLPGTLALGAAGRAGAAEDPVSLQAGTSWPWRAKAPSAGAGGPMASAGRELGALEGQVGSGRTPGPPGRLSPAAPGRARRSGRGVRGGARAATAAQPPPADKGAGWGRGWGGKWGEGAGHHGVTLPPAAPFNSGPAPLGAARAPPIGALAPQALGWVCARGQWEARGGRAAGGAGAARSRQSGPCC